jgi:nucleotide-binding universal stress UspA family protein
MSAAAVLCPVDFSDPSRTALLYAAAIAEHFGAALTLLAVDDPLLAEAAASAGLGSSLTEQTTQELRRLAAEVVGAPHSGTLQLRARAGKPAAEILREAHDSGADLIVMGSRGQTGVRKLFFGSTTERVLRETTVPVLVTGSHAPSGRSLDDVARQIRTVLAPVDLTAASPPQVTIAADIARALSASLLVVHVTEPFGMPVPAEEVMTDANAARRVSAESRLADLARSIPADVKADTLVVSGDPAEEIVAMTAAPHATLIVMGLHSTPPFGPRMGSVSYRVLSLTRALVLALPPKRGHA